MSPPTKNFRDKNEPTAPQQKSAPASLENLSKEELISLVEKALGGGITITFAGKANASRIGRKVRPRVTRRIKSLSVGPAEAQASNLLIEGDNLQAMATLYRERGQVDLILTDPPYNTGNDFRYNDRWEEDPNDSGLGDLVSADDGARHTKWMRFMLPRLQMMRSMLKPGGVLAICIDHRELFRLGAMLDEIFDEENRLAIINWQKAAAARPDNEHVSTATEYVLVYAKDRERATTGLLPRDNRRYSNPDNDPKGDWREGNLTARTWVAKDDYAIQSPFTGELHYPAGEGAWRHPKRNIKQWLEEWGAKYEEQNLGDGKAPALMVKRGTSGGVPPEASRAAQRKLAAGSWPFIWFGRDGQGRPRTKTYLADVKQGRVPLTWWVDDDCSAPLQLDSTSWPYSESGRSSDGASELTEIVGPGHGFTTVKPILLFEKIIQLWCPPDGLVFDPFAGSGTTGHAVLDLNQQAGATRRFILVEQGRPERGDPYASSLTANRLQHVIDGSWASGPHEPLPGGYSFQRLDKRVDAEALLRMERDEMVDTVIASHFDSNRKRSASLVRVNGRQWRYLVAKNSDGEGFFLVWDGPDRNTNFTANVYEACADEAEEAGLKPVYHVYARLYLYQTDNVRFYQIPDRILADFGLDVSSEPFAEADR